MIGRHPVILRDATREDAAAIVDLWSDCAESADSDGSEAFTQQALWRRPGVGEAAAALERTLALPYKRVILAFIGGELAGATVCSIATITPITLTNILVVTDIQVSPHHRHRSVAMTLLSAAASYGEELNCEVVMSVVPMGSREPHRYLTKIGFNQIAVLRAIQSSRLRSRLTTKVTNSRDTGKLIAVRRTLKRRHESERVR